MATMTQAARRVKSRKPVTRTCRVLEAATADDAGLLKIVHGKDDGAYFYQPIPADFGTAFRVRKFRSVESYDVLLNGRESSCTCKGHTYHGHCKHTAALQA